jgi:hypothetical protein
MAKRNPLCRQDSALSGVVIIPVYEGRKFKILLFINEGLKIWTNGRCGKKG